MQFKIRELRRAKGMSQDELAGKSGISRVTISALENGTARATTTKTLLAIAGALDTTIDCLFFTQDVELVQHNGRI